MPGSHADAVVLRRRRHARATPRPTASARRLVRVRPVAQHDTTIADPEPERDRGRSCPTGSGSRRPAGTALAYETAPLAERRDASIGNSSVDLWLKSTAPDTDIQVTITEVRPDGKEMYVQNGWLRASDRALSPDATDAAPDASAHRRTP